MYIPSALRRHWDALIDPPLLFSRKQGLDTIFILTRTKKALTWMSVLFGAPCTLNNDFLDSWEHRVLLP